MKRDRESDVEDENSKKHRKKIVESYGKALVDACRLGDLDVAEVLIRRGADVETRDDLLEYSALHWAAIEGHVDVAKVLIQNGADMSAVDWEKQTALHFAAKEGHVDIVKVLIQNVADVNAVDEWKSTALHWAAEKGHVDVAKVLLQKGADVNAVTKKKSTVLRISVLNKHTLGHFNYFALVLRLMRKLSKMT